MSLLFCKLHGMSEVISSMSIQIFAFISPFSLLLKGIYFLTLSQLYYTVIILNSYYAGCRDQCEVLFSDIVLALALYRHLCPRVSRAGPSQ